VTLVGAANLDVVAAAGDNTSDEDGVDAALTQTASTRGAAMTTGAATQDFFIERYDAATTGPRKPC
jgi:hypothetical protein